MKRLYSGLDAWRYIVQSESHPNTVESYLPLILGTLGALGILPFAVQRYLQGQWLAATIDLMIVAGFVAFGVYVYNTRRVRVASIAISVFCIFGVVANVYLVGSHQIFWAYPALIAIFYLVRPHEAIVLALITLVALAPALLNFADPNQIPTVLITIIIMSSIAFSFSMITSQQREQLIQLATKDPLTGAGNRRRLDDRLTAVVDGYKRTGEVASLVLLDLDHFKKVNDIHGHAAGDQILKSITEIVNLRIRVTDSLYRIGGEEFVVLLEGRDLHRAAHLAEQLRTLVEANELVPDQPVTISLGVAELKIDESATDWLRRADEALYRAKRSGRNATNLSD